MMGIPNPVNYYTLELLPVHARALPPLAPPPGDGEVAARRVHLMLTPGAPAGPARRTMATRRASRTGSTAGSSSSAAKAGWARPPARPPSPCWPSQAGRADAAGLDRSRPLDRRHPAGRPRADRAAADRTPVGAGDRLRARGGRVHRQRPHPPAALHPGAPARRDGAPGGDRQGVARGRGGGAVRPRRRAGADGPRPRTTWWSSTPRRPATPCACSPCPSCSRRGSTDCSSAANGSISSPPCGGT